MSDFIYICDCHKQDELATSRNTRVELNFLSIQGKICSFEFLLYISIREPIYYIIQSFPNSPYTH